MDKTDDHAVFGITAYFEQHSLERQAWLFMRVSAVLLWILALGHLYLIHIVHDSAAIDYSFVVRRWSNPLWRLYDWLLLSLGVLHGWNGLRIVLDDVLPQPRLKALAEWLVICSGLLILGLGTWVLISVPKGV